MMKQIVILLLLLSICHFLSAQSQRAVLPVNIESDQSRWESPVYEVPLADVDPFLAYFLKWEGDPGEIQIRFSREGQIWTDWQSMPRDEHSPELPVSILGNTEAGMRYFQLHAARTQDTQIRISCHFYSPGKTTVVSERPVERPGGGRSCSDLVPTFTLRSEWCPAGNCHEMINPSFAGVTHLIIHHSAGSNQSGDWPAVVRSIWDFHVNGRGWSDIGYNWLVDPQGRIYQGRSKDAVGAHFCGNNTGTIGICMLGDFTKTAPQGEAIDALEQLLSWKLCENAIDPMAEVYHHSSGKMLPTVIGHRDGCATACPGDFFYPQLTGIRNTLALGPTTGVAEQHEQLSFQLFPNPNPGQFRILPAEESNGDLQVTVYDLLGQRVMGPVELNKSGFITLPATVTSGTYFLLLQSAEGKQGIKKVSVIR